MKGIKISRKITAIFAISAIILWALGADAAEKKAKSAPPEKPPAKEIFIPCHPLGADMSPEGNRFVNANPEPPTLSVLEFGAAQKQRQIRLPKRAHDLIFIDETKVLVSFGPWGEVVVTDVQSASVGDPFQVGTSAEAMCKVAGGRLVVIDSRENSIHLVDTNSKAVLKTIPVNPKAAQMRWAVPDLDLEIADAQGKLLGKIELPR